MGIPAGASYEPNSMAYFSRCNEVAVQASLQSIHRAQHGDIQATRGCSVQKCYFPHVGLPADVNVIAWGLSLERPTMILYNIDNIRELFGHKVDLEKVKSNPICSEGRACND
ncbi:unnamed protein product [Calypogeia fissa]